MTIQPGKYQAQKQRDLGNPYTVWVFDTPDAKELSFVHGTNVEQRAKSKATMLSKMVPIRDLKWCQYQVWFTDDNGDMHLIGVVGLSTLLGVE